MSQAVPTHSVGLGIIGCGDILDAYMFGLRRFNCNGIVTRLADVDVDRAKAGAERHDVTAFGDVDALWDDDKVGVVISLTPPTVHHQIIHDAVSVGKHIYTEKPLATTVQLARAALGDARDHGTIVGSAPDTLLGPAAQTARSVIDSGEIGEVISVVAVAPYNRAELWHPNPGFLFQPGGGPLLDLAPYHISWLVYLIGPVVRVAGLGRRSEPTRSITSADGRSIEIPVDVDTHHTAALEFRSGAIGTFICSFDVWANHLPPLEIYGSLGTVSLSHPNWYDGDIRVRLHEDHEWRTKEPTIPPVQTDPSQKIRGLGVIDLLDSMNGRPHRTNSALAFHTLEILEAIRSSGEAHEYVQITSQPDPSQPLDQATVERWWRQ